MKDVTLQISELEFHKVLGKSTNKISALEQEKVALLKEVEKLKEMLKPQAKEA